MLFQMILFENTVVNQLLLHLFKKMIIDLEKVLCNHFSTSRVYNLLLFVIHIVLLLF